MPIESSSSAASFELALTDSRSCQGRWTLYFDPAVSLLITCIIFSSALPLGELVSIQPRPGKLLLVR
jgi:hypothetical protein